MVRPVLPIGRVDCSVSLEAIVDIEVMLLSQGVAKENKDVHWMWGRGRGRGTV